MLVGNRSVLLKSPGRFLAGTVACTDRSNWTTKSTRKSAAFSLLASIPNGYYQGAWLLPESAGGMSSAYNARADVGGSGTLYGGITAGAPASFALAIAGDILPLDDTPQTPTAQASVALAAGASGSLITQGAGSASIAIGVNAPLMTASLTAIGSAQFDFAAAAQLTAPASMLGDAALTLSPAATILPAVDTPPARTATAQFTFAGSLTPYAIGNMTGSTLNAEELTTTTIAAAVWQSLAASFADAGTMGQKLNNAASGGVDYADLANAVWNHTQ